MKLFLLITSAVFFLLPGVYADASLQDEFVNPPDSARPGVYWYFMDGNLDQQEMINDLDSMKAAGLGHVVHLEVFADVPRGPVVSLSDQWVAMFVNTIRHAEKIGIDVTIGIGPGWTGSGGPWIKPEESMQHLVYSETNVKGPVSFNGKLAIAPQRDHWWKMLDCKFYEDVAVYAFPACKAVIEKADQKAFYKRGSYSSGHSTAYFAAPAKHEEVGVENVIDPKSIIDLTKNLQKDGTLKWEVPAGEWTVLRFGRRSNGTSNRPASLPVVGLDHDKFSKELLEKHFENYCGKLFKAVGKRSENARGGLKAIHLDSWEMNAQNWSPEFPEEFRKRRGYDFTPYMATYSGRVVKDVATSERVLWDVRQTVNELILENYAGHLKTLADKHGVEFSIEPYGMTQTADLELGVFADVPMGEFWSTKYDTSDGCIEAASIAHVLGRPIVGSESFTGHRDERGRHYPGSLKNQGDWAFAIGINKFAYHTFTHKALGEKARPGMTMGQWGIRWDRGQTWWPMVGDYHRYVARCSHVLRQGVTVSDILYLTPEGAPHVFEPPKSALVEDGVLPYKKGYSFDACPPSLLKKMEVNHKGYFGIKGGTQYRLLVLPRLDTMTPGLLKEIMRLVKAGATAVGYPPSASPSMEGYPECDKELKKLVPWMWGRPPYGPQRGYGNGLMFLDKGAKAFIDSRPEEATRKNDIRLYPEYEFTAEILREWGLVEDFSSDKPLRYTHRKKGKMDIYFVSNPQDKKVEVNAAFRAKGMPELWDPLTGQIRSLPQYKWDEKRMTIPMTFAPHESFFVVFKSDTDMIIPGVGFVNFPEVKQILSLKDSWDVSFDPKWGGPEKVTFKELIDWTKHRERGIKYYSGIASYKKTFDAARVKGKRVYLDLGTVHDMARVTLNGKDLGVLWCAPWRVDVTGVLKEKNNKLQIEVANRWSNRQLGDTQAPEKNVRTLKWDSGMLGGKAYKAGRYTFSTGKELGKLLPSGLIGPVRIMVEE